MHSKRTIALIPLKIQPGMTATAHAGALNTEDNTLDSARAGLACVGSGCIEVDVRFLPDGDAVLHHNAASQDCARLEDVFAMMQNYEGSINLDMKEHPRAFITKICEMAAEYGLQDRAFFTGISLKQLDCVQGQTLPFYINCTPKKTNTAELLEAVKSAGALGLNIHRNACSERLVQSAHAMGLKVSVWTVNRKMQMKKLLRMGVDNITTRRPDMLLEIINHAA